jgi:hypothetical protein
MLRLQTVLVETVFQYRTLLGKCELAYGLDWSEIEMLAQIEHAFASRERRGRRFRREKLKLEAFLRGDGIHDRVELVEIGPGGFVIRQAPFVARGESVELVVELDSYSYRFRAAGVWLKDDGDDYRAGFAFVGTPVRLHRVQLSVHKRDVIDRIAAAA